MKNLRSITIIVISLTLLIIIFENINKLTKRQRILCLVTTTPKNHKTKAIAVKETWGKRCDVLLFVSSKLEAGLPIIKADCSADDHDHLWCKNRKGVIEAHNHFYDDYDWFYKADDDTYAVIENLRYLISGYEPTDPIWFGCPFHFSGKYKTKYHSGG